MGELRIRIEDARLLETLTEMARAHNHTVEAEVEELVQNALEKRARRLDLVRRADMIAARTPKGVKQTDSADLIREMREERDRELGR
jgi:hypothetical protein